MHKTSIALTSGLKEFAHRRAAEGGYRSVSEYVRELIRRDQRQSAQASLENQLLLGLASGPAKKMTKKDWAHIRLEVQQLISARR